MMEAWGVKKVMLGLLDCELLMDVFSAAFFGLLQCLEGGVLLLGH